MKPEACFSPDYFIARERFRAAARSAGAELDGLSIEALGPAGQSLTIDIARLGARDASRVLLHTSGLHGVEAFAGSATQLAALGQAPAIPADCALVLAHVLNPYGMAWLRRANESNVDLNRNFLRREERWEGAPALYRRLDPLINPPTPPAADAFRLRLALFALRHGMGAPRQAIAEGQYEFPRGLFYGGSMLERGPRQFLDWLQSNLAPAEYLLVLDMHTGLGPHGSETVILEGGVGTTPMQELAGALGRRLIDPSAGQAAYRIRGGMAPAMMEALPDPRIDFLLQEIGTCSPFAVLNALREENRSHHYGSRDPGDPARRALLEALSPASARWRARAVSHGLSLLGAAAAWAFRGESQRPPPAALAPVPGGPR